MPKGGENTSKNIIRAMPSDAFSVISEYLPINDFIKLTWVSKVFKEQADSVQNPFWQQAFKRHFPGLVVKNEKYAKRTYELILRKAMLFSRARDEISWLDRFKAAEKIERFIRIDSFSHMPNVGQIIKLTRDAKDHIHSPDINVFDSNFYNFNADIFASNKSAYFQFMRPFYDTMQRHYYLGSSSWFDMQICYGPLVGGSSLSTSKSGANQKDLGLSYDLTNPNQMNALGETQLMHAAAVEDLDGVNALIKAGAAIDVQTKDGRTVFDFVSKESGSGAKILEELEAFAKHFVSKIKLRTMFFYTKTGQYSVYSKLQEVAWRNKDELWPDLQVSLDFLHPNSEVLKENPIINIYKVIPSPLAMFPVEVGEFANGYNKAKDQEYGYITSNIRNNFRAKPLLLNLMYGKTNELNIPGLRSELVNLNVRDLKVCFNYVVNSSFEFLVDNFKDIIALFATKVEKNRLLAGVIKTKQHATLMKLLAGLSEEDLKEFNDIAYATRSFESCAAIESFTFSRFPGERRKKRLRIPFLEDDEFEIKRRYPGAVIGQYGLLDDLRLFH